MSTLVPPGASAQSWAHSEVVGSASNGHRWTDRAHHQVRLAHIAGGGGRHGRCRGERRISRAKSEHARRGPLE
jgi:hypothetical protein